MNVLRSAFFWWLVFFCGTVSGQYITIDESHTATTLVQDILIDNSCANASNVAISGFTSANGGSYGYFTAGTSNFPFADGIVLTTGTALGAIGPNASLLSDGPTSWGGDSDLEQALNINGSFNATVLEFDFLPISNKISFDYIFSSEQYLTNPSANQCNYTDGFAFLLKEANTSNPYQNLAVVPNSNIPVRVNTVRGEGTVCPAANEIYFGGFNGSEHPTNYNGQTVVLTAKSAVIPNTLYHIKLVVADQGNNLYDSAIFLGAGSFKVEEDLGPDRLLATNNPLCPGEIYPLDATQTGTGPFQYQWFKNNVLLPNETNPAYPVTDAGTYSVTIDLGNSCTATGKAVIEYSTLAINTPATLVQCDPDHDGAATFNLPKINDFITAGNAQLAVTYYLNLPDAQNLANPISNPAAFQSATANQIVARVSNSFGCVAYAVVDLQISNNTIAAQNPVTVCDTVGAQDGLGAVDFPALVTPQLLSGLPSGLLAEYYASESDALLQTSPLAAFFSNTVAYEQTVYARVVNGTDCYGIVPIVLKISGFDPDELADEAAFICDGDLKTLEVPDVYTDYLWSTGDTDHDAIINAAGIYTVAVTNADGCVKTKTFNATASGPATITGVEITDFQGSSNAVLIHYSGSGDYEFSLDGVHFQASPLFTSVEAGQYTVQIHDRNGCVDAVAQTIFVLDYPKYFTPNGDGYHDVWKIQNLQSQPNAVVSIFDRYGKLVYSFKSDGPGWNGKLNGIDLPSTDYWFTITFPEKITVKNHFSLKR